MRCTQILLERLRPADTFGRTRGWGCGAVYEPDSIPYPTTVHHSLNAVARGRSGLLVQHGHRACSLCNRIYYGAGAHVPLDAQRLLRFACGLHGYMRTTRAHVPVKTAMEKKQTRERQRYTRTIAPGPSGRWKKSSYLTPYLGRVLPDREATQLGSQDFDKC